MNPMVADLVRRSAGLALPARAGGPAPRPTAAPLQGAVAVASGSGAAESASGVAQGLLLTTADSPDISWGDATGPRADATDAAAFEDRTSSGVVTDLGMPHERTAFARMPRSAAATTAPVDPAPSAASPLATTRGAAARPGSMPVHDAMRSPAADARHRVVDSPDALPPAPPAVASGGPLARQTAFGVPVRVAPPAAAAGIESAHLRVAAEAPAAQATARRVPAEPVAPGPVAARAQASSTLAALPSTGYAGEPHVPAPAAPSLSADGATPARTPDAIPLPAGSTRVWPTEPAAAAPASVATTVHSAQARGEVHIQIGMIEIRGAPPPLPPTPAPVPAPREPEGFADFDRWRRYAPWDGV